MGIIFQRYISVNYLQLLFLNPTPGQKSPESFRAYLSRKAYKSPTWFYQLDDKVSTVKCNYF